LGFPEQKGVKNRRGKGEIKKPQKGGKTEADEKWGLRALVYQRGTSQKKLSVTLRKKEKCIGKKNGKNEFNTKTEFTNKNKLDRGGGLISVEHGGGWGV